MYAVENMRKEYEAQTSIDDITKVRLEFAESQSLFWKCMSFW